MKRQSGLRVLMCATTLAAGGYALGVGSCAQKVANNVNPCGTIFSTQFCDPVAWQNMVADITPQDWGRDPTCTIPGLCGPWPAGSTTTGDPNAETSSTTTTTTTNTTNSSYGGLSGYSGFGT